MHVGPEILKKEKYGTKIDCWAMGVVVYTIIGGRPPFYAQNNQAVFQKILKVEYDFDDEEMWGHITVRLQFFKWYPTVLQTRALFSLSFSLPRSGFQCAFYYYRMTVGT